MKWDWQIELRIVQEIVSHSKYSVDSNYWYFLYQDLGEKDSKFLHYSKNRDILHVKPIPTNVYYLTLEILSEKATRSHRNRTKIQIFGSLRIHLLYLNQAPSPNYYCHNDYLSLWLLFYFFNYEQLS